MPMNPYNNSESAQGYLDFLNSKNGQIQQLILLEALLKKIGTNRNAKILDAACGSGWLAGNLATQNFKASGFDNSKALIAHAKKQFPEVNFTVADITQPLPYADNSFDTIILNMAATDLSKPETSYLHLAKTLKNDGTFLITIPNPYYAYPIGIWKRGIIGRLLRRKPKLKLRALPYNSKELLPSWDPKHPTSHSYSLPDHITTITKAGFQLNDLTELRTTEDSPDFNLQYQLYRYPLILLLEFKKPPR